MSFSALLTVALAACVSAAPTVTSAYKAVAAASPTVYLAGDSTMAKGGGGTGTQGWGQYLHYSLNIPVVNDAVAGRSARSYTREGRFTTLINTVKSGDFVVIEFGHNDGGSLTPTDNGRSDCAGTTTQTCQTTYNGVAETVKTFPAYLEAAAASLKAKGANVIIASQTPDNTDETGTFVYSPSRFVGYAQTAATASSVTYVDHGAYVAAAYKSRSVAAVNAFYPNDHTHTSPDGAIVVAHAFVKGIVCAKQALYQHVINATSTIEGSCI